MLSSSVPPTRSESANMPDVDFTRRYTPEPTYDVAPVFPSPVASHSAPSGATRKSPVDSVGSPSVMGVQVEPPSLDRNTPPSAPPAKIMLPDTARPVIRPATRPAPPPELEKNGSRYRGSSESYGRFVTSAHVPDAIGSEDSELNAAV